jgi:transposase
MTGKRKRYSAEFKAKVALGALRGEQTTAQLTTVGDWKKQAMEGLMAVFSGKSEAQETAKSAEAEVEKLRAKIGQR